MLAAADQELAFDNALPGATVGGSLAIAPSGPRRLLRGTLRDLLIGVTFVRSDGVVAKAGGRVVKNVAGYDFGKLLTGSYGTLGLITEAVFRLHPRPAARVVVSARASDAASVARAAHSVVASQTVPSAVEIDWPAGTDSAGGGATVAVLLEGTDEGVAARGETVQLLLEPTGTGSPTADPGPRTGGAAIRSVPTTWVSSSPAWSAGSATCSTLPVTRRPGTVRPCTCGAALLEWCTPACRARPPPASFPASSTTCVHARRRTPEVLSC